MANDRIYQEPVEAVIAPTDQRARLYQAPAEVLILPSDQEARLSQLVVEVLYPSSNPVGGATGYSFGYIIG